MTARVQRWDNSLAVRIPKAAADALHFGENTDVDLDMQEGSLVIRPVRRRRNSLDEPLAGTDSPSEFERLAAIWKSETALLSNEGVIILHPAYQQIIGLGEPAVPLILDALVRGDRDRWFWALRSITRENPVAEQEAGNVNKMAEAWIEWGTERGYLSASRQITRHYSPASLAPVTR